MRRALALSLLLSVAPWGRADAIDDFVRAAMEKDHIPGVCLAVVSPIGDADVRSYGLANLETQTPYTPDTVHRIASLSKQFCAYAILTLERQGKLSRNDPLSKHFPEGSKEWEGITIAQTLAHRSGIAEYDIDFNKTYTTEEYVTMISTKPLAEKPGEKYRYNNVAYALLGLLVQKVSGVPLSEFVRKTVFEPIGMASTRYFDAAEVVAKRSDAYRWRNGKYVNPTWLRPKVWDGSGGILSTMEDFLRYERELRDPKVLDPAILAYQWTPFAGAEEGYGAGWFREKLGEGRALIHTGSTWGFTSCFLRDVTDGWTIILFRNAEGGSSSEWAKAILKLAKPVKVVGAAFGLR